MRLRRSPSTLVLLAALPLVLAGCGGEEETAATDPLTTSPSPTATASSQPTSPTPSPSPAADAEPEPEAAPTGTDVFQVGPGTCFDDAGESGSGLNEVEQLPVVPCEQPHPNEVFATLTQPDGPFPGEEEIQGLATDGCFAEFEAYVGVPFEESRYTAYPITPTEQSWATGDRTVLCVLTVTPPQAGSAAGSRA